MDEGEQEKKETDGHGDNEQRGEDPDRHEHPFLVGSRCGDPDRVVQITYDNGEKPDHNTTTYSGLPSSRIIARPEEIMRQPVWILMAILFAAAAAAQTPSRASQSHSKITKEQATATALTKVPNGTIKESELEREHGKLVWSFDIATAGSKDITEVQVDANSGEVVSVEKESAKAEAAEKKGAKHSKRK